MVFPFQFQPRRYFQKIPLQANFYPMPTMAYIQDSQYRLTLHTAQALGVSSLASGQYIEFLNIEFVYSVLCVGYGDKLNVVLLVVLSLSHIPHRSVGGDSGP